MSDRHVCTKEDPFVEGKHERSAHPDAKFLFDEDGYPGGDIDHYECPNCGTRFRVEVPQ